jgi:hypothetical protein
MFYFRVKSEDKVLLIGRDFFVHFCNYRNVTEVEVDIIMTRFLNNFRNN